MKNPRSPEAIHDLITVTNGMFKPWLSSLSRTSPPPSTIDEAIDIWILLSSSVALFHKDPSHAPLSPSEVKQSLLVAGKSLALAGKRLSTMVEMGLFGYVNTESKDGRKRFLKPTKLGESLVLDQCSIWLDQFSTVYQKHIAD